MDKLKGYNRNRDYRTYCMERLKPGQVVAYKQLYKPTNGGRFHSKWLKLTFVKPYRYFAQFKAASGRILSVHWTDVYGILTTGKYSDPLAASVLGGWI